MDTSGPRTRCGIDTVEISRIERWLRETPEEDLLRIFAPEELNDAGQGAGRAASIAARFAAKEAVSKALGVGMRHMSPHGIRWHEVEVLPDGLGKPVLYLHGRAAALSCEQGLREWSISLTHGREVAIAFVVAMG